MNKNQRIIIAICVPLALFLISWLIADKALPWASTIDPWEIDRTWYVWLTYIVVVGFIEFMLFADKKNNKNK